jgi:hypothetical protein
MCVKGNKMNETQTQSVTEDTISPAMANAHDVLGLAPPTEEPETPVEVEKVYVQTEDLVSGTPVN